MRAPGNWLGDCRCRLCVLDQRRRFLDATDSDFQPFSYDDPPPPSAPPQTWGAPSDIRWASIEPACRACRFRMCSWDFDIYRIYWTRVKALMIQMQDAQIQNQWTMPMGGAYLARIRYVPGGVVGGACAAAFAAVEAEAVPAAAPGQRWQWRPA